VLRKIKIIDGVKPVRQFFNGRGLNLSCVYSHGAYALLAFEYDSPVIFKSNFVDGTAEIHRAALSLHCDARTACLAGRDSSKGKDHECDEAEHAVRVAQVVPKENSRSSIRIPLGMTMSGRFTARLKPCPSQSLKASQPSENLSAAQTSVIREDPSWTTRLPSLS